MTVGWLSRLLGQKPAKLGGSPDHAGMGIVWGNDPSPREIARQIVGAPPKRTSTGKRLTPEERAERDAYRARKREEEARQHHVMMVAAAQRSLKQYRASGVVKAVRILADCCPTCDVRAGRAYPLESPPPIPQPDCERGHPGCACCYTPVVE